MPEANISIIRGDKTGVETDYRDALLVNMYAVKREILGVQGYILSYPGLVKHGDVPGIDRGGVYNERLGLHFRVSGTNLISVNTNGTHTILGTIIGSKQAALPYSFNTQCVVADGNAFLYDPTNGFRQITDSDLGNPIDAIWIDGYYFFTDGNFIYHTDLANESSIDPLKYATAEFMPDPSLGVSKTQDNKVIVWGRYSMEYFVNAATANFAFQRIESRSQKIGIVSTHAKCETGDKFYIVGSRKDEAVSIYAVALGSIEKIATREIDKLISVYSDNNLSDIRVESRLENDITFVIFHLPNETLCFNETIAKSFGIEVAWTILKSGTNVTQPYRAINGVIDPRIGKYVYGDKYQPILGILDNSICSQYGQIAESEFYSPFIDIETKSVDELNLETIPGHTVTDDAKVAFSITLDGLFYGTEWWYLYGAPHDYGKRFFLRRLGYVGEKVGFKFRAASLSRMAFSAIKMKFS